MPYSDDCEDSTLTRPQKTPQQWCWTIFVQDLNQGSELRSYTQENIPEGAALGDLCNKSILQTNHLGEKWSKEGSEQGFSTLVLLSLAE